MEFDLEYELVEWEGETRPLTEKTAPILKEILETGVEEFGEKEMAKLTGHKSLARYLGYLWRAGLVRRYGAVSSSKRPKTLWEIDYDSCLQNLSGDPEIRNLLQAHARRQFTLVQTGRAQGAGVVSDCRVARKALTSRRPS